MARILGSEFDADLVRGMTDADGIAPVALHERIAPVGGFACFDHRLRAAATEGFSVFPDTLPSL